MEALGVNIELTAERIAACIDEIGIGFLHAPLLHNAMKYVGPARKQMGIRTIFNMLGPLTNPAGADAQVIGVYSEPLTEVLAGVLAQLGSRRALVVHGSDGLDEITISGPSKITELRDGKVSTSTVSPEDFGLSTAPLKEIKGGEAATNAQIIIEVLEGRPGPRRDIVVLNAAAALLASSTVKDLSEGVHRSVESIDRGNAREKLDRLVAFTNR
jgi:anthranilate phosphoribosyltransferase